MLTYTVSLTKVTDTAGRAKAPGKAKEVSFDISRDANPDLLNPAELLLAAFGGCLLKNISKLAPKMRLVIDDVRVEVTGIREDNPPRIAAISYRLALTTEERKERMEQLVDYLHKYGTVYNTLVPTLSVTERIVLERGNGQVEQLNTTSKSLGS